MPYPDCGGPPFNSEEEVVRGGGLTFLTKDILVKAAVWRCRELHEEVECKSAEIIRLHNREREIVAQISGKVDALATQFQKQGLRMTDAGQPIS